MNAAHAPRYIRAALRHRFRTAAGDAAIWGTYEEAQRLEIVARLFDSPLVCVPPEFVKEVKRAALDLSAQFEDLGQIAAADDAKKFTESLDTNCAM